MKSKADELRGEPMKYNPASLDLKADLVDLIQEARQKHTNDEVLAMVADESSLLMKKGRAQSMSDAFLKPEVQGAMVAYSYGRSEFPGMDLNRLITDLEGANKTIAGGNLQTVEAMLFSQANALSAVFVTLARKANGIESLEQHETLMRLAFKAQAQCRATLETLAEIKNPPQVAFVKQANYAAGHQQVNNGMTQPALPVRAEGNGSLPNKQLEHHRGERLDLGTAETAGRADQAMETVGALNGAQVARRKGPGGTERLSRRDARAPAKALSVAQRSARPLGASKPIEGEAGD